MTSGQHAEQPPAKRRDRIPAISDQALLVAIEADLEASPWEERLAYRKVWARLRVCRDIRLAPQAGAPPGLRENNRALAPSNCRRRGGNPHDGEIISQNRLARDIDVPAARISEIVRGRRTITADTALRLAKYFGTSPDVWLGLQMEYDLRRARRDTWPAIEPHSRDRRRLSRSFAD